MGSNWPPEVTSQATESTEEDITLMEGAYMTPASVATTSLFQCIIEYKQPGSVVCCRGITSLPSTSEETPRLILMTVPGPLFTEEGGM